MTDLATLVAPLKLEVAVPGEFATTFPSTTDNDLAGSLANAFGQAQLDGFFGTQTIDLTDMTHPTVTPDLSSGAGALVILYSSESIIRSQLRRLRTMTKYESAGSVYEVQQSASVLVEELKAVQARRLELLALIRRQLRANRAVYVSDAYIIRAFGYYPTGYYGELGSFYGYELAGLNNALALGGF